MHSLKIADSYTESISALILAFYLPFLLNSISSPSLFTRTHSLSQWCWAGSGRSKLFSMAIMVESGMGVALKEFLVKAVDSEQSTHTSAYPRLSLKKGEV